MLGSQTLFPPPLPLHVRSIGYLSQETQLFPHFTRVDQNVRYGIERRAGAAGDDWIAELRERLQLGAVWRERATAISGGQARRVALARMLAPKPRLVLLDEPFSGLDRQLVRELLTSVAQWQKLLGFTMLVADHAADALERLCSRAIALEADAPSKTPFGATTHGRQRKRSRTCSRPCKCDTCRGAAKCRPAAAFYVEGRAPIPSAAPTRSL